MKLRLAVLALVIGSSAGYVAYLLHRPYAAFGDETFIDFPKGTGSAQMADMLARAGVIAHTWEFLAVRALEPRRSLKAGEYQFTKPASVLEVYDRIARGDIFYYTLTVPEGQNLFDIAAEAEKLELFAAADFLRAARDGSSIRDLDPAAPSLEGYLFPSSYRLERHTTPERLCHLMTTRFREVWKEMGAPGNVHAVVTLASLVEREARFAMDRPLIASVFSNRLKIGMKLDCDPTTIYAALLDGRYRGTIHQSDLASTNRYNTYRSAGLPPGPIANPGKDSLLAAIHPAETGYLYFVLRPDGSGAHNFSKSISEHLVATAKFRRASRREQVEEGTPRRVSPGRKSQRSN
ncbi:MAG: endolytic transglycosylase MltG [Acidobacteriia bacterium]|nr:endolytic transglycosylase MltG [Terriglobia bacterium]